MPVAYHHPRASLTPSVAPESSSAPFPLLKSLLGNRLPLAVSLCLISNTMGLLSPIAFAPISLFPPPKLILSPIAVTRAINLWRHTPPRPTRRLPVKARAQSHTKIIRLRQIFHLKGSIQGLSTPEGPTKLYRMTCQRPHLICSLLSDICSRNLMVQKIPARLLFSPMSLTGLLSEFKIPDLCKGTKQSFLPICKFNLPLLTSIVSYHAEKLFWWVACRGLERSAFQELCPASCFHGRGRCKRYGQLSSLQVSLHRIILSWLHFNILVNFRAQRVNVKLIQSLVRQAS